MNQFNKSYSYCVFILAIKKVRKSRVFDHPV